MTEGKAKQILDMLARRHGYEHCEICKKRLSVHGIESNFCMLAFFHLHSEPRCLWEESTVKDAFIEDLANGSLNIARFHDASSYADILKAVIINRSQLWIESYINGKISKFELFLHPYDSLESLIVEADLENVINE